MRVDLFLDYAVPSNIATELLAVLREALSNVARHAHATQVEISVEAASDVVLRVVDNGVGLPADRRAGGHGLVNMRARATRLGGDVLLAPAPGGGTTIEWRVDSPEGGRRAL